jgi:hypothetical protein
MKPSDNLTDQEQDMCDLLLEASRRIAALHDAKLTGKSFYIAKESDALHVTMKAIVRHSPDFML